VSKLLDIRGLVASFETDSGWVRAVDGVSFSVKKGQTLGIVGESGCGKTVTAMSILDLLPRPSGNVLEGEILFKGENLRETKRKRMSEIRGGEIGVVFQDSEYSLSPAMRIGDQVVEAIRLHYKMSHRDAQARTREVLKVVGVPASEELLRRYPHELSSGMRQRIMIAMALSCEPDLLIADEPTTALDLTVQAQILNLIDSMKRRLGMGVLLITHDLGMVAQYCDDVAVMYAGRVVEHASVGKIFNDPKHAYTQALLGAIPRLENERRSQLETIPGQVARIEDLVAGCRFCQRVDRDKSVLLRTRPEFLEIWDGHWVEVCPECYKG